MQGCVAPRAAAPIDLHPPSCACEGAPPRARRALWGAAPPTDGIFSTSPQPRSLARSPRAVCLPGYYGPNCSPCPVGMFGPGGYQGTCTLGPTTQPVTAGVASISTADCLGGCGAHWLARVDGCLSVSLCVCVCVCVCVPICTVVVPCLALSYLIPSILSHCTSCTSVSACIRAHVHAGVLTTVCQGVHACHMCKHASESKAGTHATSAVCSCARSLLMPAALRTLDRSAANCEAGRFYNTTTRICKVSAELTVSPAHASRAVRCRCIV